MVLFETQASLDLNPGFTAMKYISESCPHRSRLLIQDIPVTGTHSLTGKLCPTTKTFSLSDLPLCLSAYPLPHTPHIGEELSLPREGDLSECCIPLSRNMVIFPSPSEKVSANTLALQDLGHGGDTSESKRYDTPYDRHCALNILFPPHPLIISPPSHSPTGKSVELCPSGYWK